MKDYVLVDPALSSAFLKISDDAISKNEIINSNSVSFWKNLDGLLKLSKNDKSQTYIFINFGPGSYTGLKQSKILAETFKSAGYKIFIYNQNDVLKISAALRMYFTPAYKGQNYVSLKQKDNSVTNQLMNLNDFEEFFKKESLKPNEVVTINSNNEKYCVSTLEDIYQNITLEELMKISMPYDEQNIVYYRAPQEDYQVTQHD